MFRKVTVGFGYSNYYKDGKPLCAAIPREVRRSNDEPHALMSERDRPDIPA